MGLAALARDENRIQQILGEHRALADAVAAGEEEAARAIIDDHLHTTLVLLRAGTRL